MFVVRCVIGYLKERINTAPNAALIIHGKSEMDSIKIIIYHLAGLLLFPVGWMVGKFKKEK